MQDAIAQAEDICEPPEYLPKEDDHNNIEYKFYMCNITFNKLEKRHTQMSYRLNVSWLITQIFHILACMRFGEIQVFVSRFPLCSRIDLN